MPCRSVSKVSFWILTFLTMLGIFVTPSFGSPHTPGDRGTLSFAIVPQQSATRLAKIWAPLLQEISERIGKKLVFATTKDIPSFEACLAQGAYDFAYMNPYHYVVFHEKTGYRAFARQKDKLLKGLIVVRNDSPFTKLSDLNGKMIAFPSPAAFGASVIPRAEMVAQNVQFEPRYVKSHDSVYRAVAAKIIPAGGGVIRTFNTVSPDIRAQLRVIFRTDGYTPHAFAAHPNLSSETLQSVLDAFLALSVSSSDLLVPLGMKGLEQAEDKDWDDVRSLGLSRSHTQIEATGQLICHSG